jgi:hypothetical protein
MNTSVAETMIKMLEAVPEQLQENVVEHMRDYIEDVRDEAKWNTSFSRTQDKLVAMAQLARQQIAGGQSSPLDLEKL